MCNWRFRVVEESNIDEFIGALRRAEVDEIETAEEKLKEELKRAESEYEAELQDIEKGIIEQVDTLTNNHNEELGVNVDNFQQILSELKGAAYHWDEEFWQNFSPNTINEPAECHRIGTLKINGHFNQLETLALIPIINGNNVILLSTFGSKVQMKQGFQSLILRLLITSPKNQIRLVIVDSSNEYDGIKNLFPNRIKDISRIESKFEKIIHHLDKNLKLNKALRVSETRNEVLQQMGYLHDQMSKQLKLFSPQMFSPPDPSL